MKYFLKIITSITAIEEDLNMEYHHDHNHFTNINYTSLNQLQLLTSRILYSVTHDRAKTTIV